MIKVPRIIQIMAFFRDNFIASIRVIESSLNPLSRNTPRKFQYRPKRNAPIYTAIAVNIISIILIIIPQNAHAEPVDSWLPFRLVQACETVGVVQKIKTAEVLYDAIVSQQGWSSRKAKRFLASEVLGALIGFDFTSDNCVRVARLVQQKLRLSQFNQDLENCMPYADFLGIVDQRRGQFSGRWFCDTTDFGDWLKFHNWKSNKFAEADQLMQTEEPLMDVGPVFEVSELSSFTEPKPTDAFRVCMENTGNLSAADRRNCMATEERRHDAALNIAYSCLREKLSKNEFIKLRQSQRNWIEATKQQCAYAEEQGTIALDLQASCSLDQTMEKALELSKLASLNDCVVPAPNSVADDLDVWVDNADTLSVSNSDALRFTVLCGERIRGRLISLNHKLVLRDVVPTGSTGSWLFRDTSGRVTSMGPIYLVNNGTFIEFDFAANMLDAFKSGSSVEIEADPFGSVFSLRGSATAIEGCLKDPTESTVVSSEPVLSYPTYQETSEGVYVDLDGSLPLRLRCDRPNPEIYARQSFLSSLFGSGMSAEASWSFELFRNGRSINRVLRTGEKLSDGMGVKLNLGWLFASTSADLLTVESGASSYQIALAEYQQQLQRCMQTAYETLFRYMVGTWETVDVSGRTVRMFISSNIVRTGGWIQASGNFAGWPTVYPRGFHWIYDGKPSQRTYWMLAPSGNFHIQMNTYICGIETYHENEMVLEPYFDCQFKERWKRVRD